MKEPQIAEKITPLRAYRADELINWAEKEIGAPFRKITRIADDLGKGKKLTYEEALVRLPLSRIELDYRGVFPILRDALPVLAFEPANLLILMVNSDSTAILSAHLITTRDNNYTDISEVSAKEGWAEIALDLIGKNKREDLRHELDEWFRANRRQEINCVIIAKPEGLHALKDGWEEFQAKGNGYFSFLYRTLGRCIEREWIVFEPIPRIFARIADVYRIVDAPAGSWSAIFGDQAYPFKIAIGLWGRNYVSAFLYDSDKSERTGVDTDLLPRDLGPAKLAKALQKETKASYALVLHADMAINLLWELLSRPLPTNGNDTKIQLKKLLYFIRGYKSLWWIHPVPIPLKNYVRLPIRALGMPYDITRLSWWFLPDAIVDGLGIFMGDSVRFAIIFLEGTTPRGVILIDQFNRGFRQITIIPPEEIAPVFEGAAARPKVLRERLIRAKHLIWEKYGWVDWANAVQIDTLMHARKLLFGGYFNSLLRAPLAALTILKLNKTLTRGGVVVYPDMMFEESARYAKSVGVHKVRRNLLKLPFDAYHRTPRGLLYVRETIYLAAAIAAILAFLYWVL